MINVMFRRQILNIMFIKIVNLMFLEEKRGAISGRKEISDAAGGGIFLAFCFLLLFNRILCLIVPMQCNATQCGVHLENILEIISCSGFAFGGETTFFPAGFHLQHFLSALPPRIVVLTF